MENHRVLIVDDRFEEVYGLEKPMLTKYEVDCSSDRDDAIEKIKNGNYRVVITDYHLGEKSPQGGIDIVREAVNKKTILTILTSIENHKQEAWDNGAAFMYKKNLVESLSHILEGNTNGRK
jgi:DNA-binding response OmpR family regulator